MRTWAEVDLSALEHNYNALKKQIPAHCKLLAPVKANAYGHGAGEVARKLEALGRVGFSQPPKLQENSYLLFKPRKNLGYFCYESMS